MTRWMAGRSVAEPARSTGIPKGLPYLTASVIHCEVTDESFEARKPT